MLKAKKNTDRNVIYQSIYFAVVYLINYPSIVYLSTVSFIGNHFYMVMVHRVVDLEFNENVIHARCKRNRYCNSLIFLSRMVRSTRVEAPDVNKPSEYCPCSCPAHSPIVCISLKDARIRCTSGDLTRCANHRCLFSTLVLLSFRFLFLFLSSVYLYVLYYRVHDRIQGIFVKENDRGG